MLILRWMLEWYVVSLLNDPVAFEALRMGGNL